MDRIVNIAQDRIGRLDISLSPSASSDLLRSVLAGIQYCRCLTNYEFLALLIALVPSARQQLNLTQSQKSMVDRKEKDKDIKHKQDFIFSPLLNSRTSLIIIDTISYPVRSHIPDEARQLKIQRAQLIDEFRRFSDRCRSKGIKLVFSNQMGFTMRGKDGSTSTLADKDAQGELVPSLRAGGHSILGQNIWRLLLYRGGPQGVGICNRFAQIFSQPLACRSKEHFACLPFDAERGGNFIRF